MSVVNGHAAVNGSPVDQPSPPPETRAQLALRMAQANGPLPAPLPVDVNMWSSQVLAAAPVPLTASWSPFAPTTALSSPSVSTSAAPRRRQILAATRAIEATAAAQKRQTTAAIERINPLKELAQPREHGTTVFPAFVATEGPLAGIVLSMLAYWQRLAAPRMIEVHPGQREMVRGPVRAPTGLGASRADYVTSTGLTPRQVRQAIQVLRRRGLVTVIQPQTPEGEELPGRRLVLTHGAVERCEHAMRRVYRVHAHTIHMLRSALCGRYADANAVRAAIVLSQLCWWQERATIADGGDTDRPIFARSKAELANDVGLSEKQTSDALDDLKRLELVRWKNRIFGRRRILHVEVCVQPLAVMWAAERRRRTVQRVASASSMG